MHTGTDIEFEELVYGEELGFGSSSVVYAGQWRGRAVAIKELRLATNVAEDRIDSALIEFRREMFALHQIDHPNVVQLFGVSRHEQRVILVTQLVRGPTLYSLLRSPSTPAKPNAIVQQAYSIALQLAEGIAAAHAQRLVHRDIKSENILIEEGSNRAVIVDFGSARLVTEDPMTPNPAGTMRWQAPECLVGRRYNEKVDIYSFAIVLWELLHPGILPFAQYTPAEALWQAAHSDTRPAVTFPASNSLRRLINVCWHRAPKERPSAAELVSMIKRKHARFVSIGKSLPPMFTSASSSSPFGKKKNKAMAAKPAEAYGIHFSIPKKLDDCSGIVDPRASSDVAEMHGSTIRLASPVSSSSSQQPAVRPPQPIAGEEMYAAHFFADD